MGMHLTILAVLLGVAGASVWYSTQMKKNYLHELEKGLELQKFEMSGSMGKALVQGVWKGQRIGVEALPSGPGMPSAIHYKMEHRSSFTAEIRPGSALLEEMSAAGKTQAKEEEETFRPWRARLTDEEQAVLAQRHGEPAAKLEEGPRERLRISSPKPDLVNQHLAQGSRHADLVRLFKEGFILVQVDYAEVVLVKSPYDARDMGPKIVESRFRTLKTLLVD